jgi:hypothetical protein
MSDILIIAGPFQFTARLETAEAPRTCEAILRQLPLTGHLLHVRWSGEAAWVPADQLGSRMAKHLFGGSVHVYVAKLTVERNKSFTNALENPFDFRNVMPQFRVEPLSIADVDDGAKQAMTGWDFFY